MKESNGKMMLEFSKLFLTKMINFYKWFESTLIVEIFEDLLINYSFEGFYIQTFYPNCNNIFPLKKFTFQLNFHKIKKDVSSALPFGEISSSQIIFQLKCVNHLRQFSFQLVFK